MRESLEQLLRAADAPSAERAEALWAEYRSGGPGAEAAFTTLLAWYGLVIYRRIWGFVRSDAADDVFQDVLAKLHRQRGKLVTFEHALRWLRTVAVRQCVDAHRRTARQKVRERKAGRPEGEAPSGERLELQEMLAVALSKLSREHREVVALVFFEGLDKQHAAKVLGINRDTLADRLNVALSRLQQLVPAPAVLAAAGTVGVPAALSAQLPHPSTNRLTELAAAAWAKAAPAGSWLGKVAAILVGLVGAGGVTWAAWPRPDPVGGVAATAEARPEPRSETLQERNRRVLVAETLPRIVESLRPMALGGGEVRVTRLLVHDFRALFDIELRHGGDPPVLAPSRVRIFLDTRNGKCSVVCDPWGRGEFRNIDVDRPIVLGRVPGLGIEWARRVEPLTRTVAILGEFPPDPRVHEAAAWHAAAVAAALAPYRASGSTTGTGVGCPPSGCARRPARTTRSTWRGWAARCWGRPSNWSSSRTAASGSGRGTPRSP